MSRPDLKRLREQIAAQKTGFRSSRNYVRTNKNYKHEETRRGERPSGAVVVLANIAFWCTFIVIFVSLILNEEVLLTGIVSGVMLGVYGVAINIFYHKEDFGILGSVLGSIGGWLISSIYIYGFENVVAAIFLMIVAIIAISSE